MIAVQVFDDHLMGIKKIFFSQASVSVFALVSLSYQTVTFYVLVIGALGVSVIYVPCSMCMCLCVREKEISVIEVLCPCLFISDRRELNKSVFVTVCLLLLLNI